MEMPWKCHGDAMGKEKESFPASRGAPGAGEGPLLPMRQDLPGSAPPASCWGCGSCDSVPLSSLQIDGKNS